MLDIQLGRRNLSPIQRIAIAEKYRSIYEKQARENQLSGLKQNQNETVLPNSVKRESIDTTKKLAEVANVGKETYRMGKKILDSSNEEVKNAVMSGEMSINAAITHYHDLKLYLTYRSWREGEAIHEVEEWKARQRSNFNLAQFSDREQCSHSEEKGQTRDIVAKIISWGTVSDYRRKALITYVELKGYKNGGNRDNQDAKMVLWILMR